MPVFDLERISRGGGRSPGPLSDLRVYGCRERDGTCSIGLRVSGATMKRMRWMQGDSVVAQFDSDAMCWTIRRVPDAGHGKKGNKLSGCGRETKTGTVRFSVNTELLAHAGLVAGSGYDCKMTSSEGDAAKFVMS